MRSSQDANSLNSRSPNCASIFSSRNTAAIFSSSTFPENSSSVTFRRKSTSCVRKISLRQRSIEIRKSAVYQPCDLIFSLKNHCTPTAWSEEPPFSRARRIWPATAEGLEECTRKYSPAPRRDARSFRWYNSRTMELRYTVSDEDVLNAFRV